MKFLYVCYVPTLESSVTFNAWMSLATALFVWCGYYEGSYLESHVRFTAVPEHWISARDRSANWNVEVFYKLRLVILHFAKDQLCLSSSVVCYKSG